ncbi:MAG: hypothetical protein ABJP70_01640 [Erythrobacter sp.]
MQEPTTSKVTKPQSKRVTAQQAKALSLAADHRENKVIAVELGISEKAVGNLIKRASETLGTNGKNATIRAFVRQYPEYLNQEWATKELDLKRELEPVELRALWEEMPHTANNPIKGLKVFDEAFGLKGRIASIVLIAIAGLLIAGLAIFVFEGADRMQGRLIEEASSSPTQ